MLLYYITDRTRFPGFEQQRREHLLATVVDAARSGVDYIQFREKDLPSRELEALARLVVNEVRETGTGTRVLINSRTDIALAVRADGVHLRSNDISPADVVRIWRAAGAKTDPVIAVSCHNEQEVIAAKFCGAKFVVFGPVFGKSASPGTGLESLRAACGHDIPVLALGGINLENSRSCCEVGASGLAGIRLFQEGNMGPTVTALRKISPSR